MKFPKSLEQGFDRVFSKASPRWQLLALFIVVICVWSALAVYARFTSVDMSMWQIVEVYIDPGCLSGVDEDKKLFGLLAAVVGAVLFSSMLISVISNILERRIEAVRRGEVFYRFNNHTVILGNDEMVAGVIKKIVADSPAGDILLQTQQDVEKVAQKLHTQLTQQQERRLTIVSARRDSLEDLLRMRVEFAKELYILGETGESDPDALTLNSLKYIAQIAPDGTSIKCITQLRYQSTYALFQTTDLPESVKGRVDFHPFNFNESWARKIFVENRNFDGTVQYKTLDYQPLTKESAKHVHLVVIGMTPMGVALAIEAAHICHFPNFVSRGIKTKITFIDPDAEREMEYFMGRHRPLLSHCESVFRKFADGAETLASKRVFTPAEGDNFLDIEWKFIEGNIASEAIQSEIDSYAKGENELLTVACCSVSSAQNIATGFYLPRSVYECANGEPSGIPILVMQSLCGDLTEVLQSSIRYTDVKPFGMTNEGYDDRLDRIEWAKRVNNIYWEKSVPEKFCTETIETQWGFCSVTDKWSNIYNVIAIPTKLRSIGISDIDALCPDHELTSDEVRLLAEVEHNRWNVEKLLAGYIPTTQEQNMAIEAEFGKVLKNEIAKPEKSLKKILNQQLHIHYDIRPYVDLRVDDSGENINSYDIVLTEGLVRIVTSR